MGLGVASGLHAVGILLPPFREKLTKAAGPGQYFGIATVSTDAVSLV